MVSWSVVYFELLCDPYACRCDICTAIHFVVLAKVPRCIKYQIKYCCKILL